MFNKSSVSHNILTGKERPATSHGGTTMFNRKLHNHKKSISDFFETGFAHDKPEYMEAVGENPHLFKKLTGMCTFFLDASAKHKNTVMRPPLRNYYAVTKAPLSNTV